MPHHQRNRCLEITCGNWSWPWIQTQSGRGFKVCFPQAYLIVLSDSLCIPEWTIQTLLHKWNMKACLHPHTQKKKTPMHPFFSAQQPRNTQPSPWVNLLSFCLQSSHIWFPHTVCPYLASVKSHPERSSNDKKQRCRYEVTLLGWLMLTVCRFEAVYLQEAPTQNNQGRPLDTVLTAALVAVKTDKSSSHTLLYRQINIYSCVRAYLAGAHHFLFHVLHGARLCCWFSIPFCLGLWGDVAKLH